MKAKTQDTNLEKMHFVQQKKPGRNRAYEMESCTKLAIPEGVLHTFINYLFGHCHFFMSLIAW